jgi:small subunit ribosomal protein S1
MEEFEALLNESFEIDTPPKGGRQGQGHRHRGGPGHHRRRLQDGRPRRSEGIRKPRRAADIAVGDEVEVYLDRVENARGEAVISREKARREEAWDRLEKAYENESASTARSSAASRAASPSIWAAPWRSCPAARSMCAPCAMPAR